MPPVDPADEPLADLASYLDARREHILRAWHDAVNADADLSAPNALSRTQFRDHVPLVLAGLSDTLRGAHDAERTDEKAGAHGAARWQQGYNLTELMREWGHLQMCLVEEFERYAELHPEVSRATMADARRLLVRLSSEAVNQSTAAFVGMRQAEAAAQVRDLEQAIQGRQGDRIHADLVRAAAHDLRGNLGIVVSAASVLARDDVPLATRTRLFDMVQRAAVSQQALLGNLIDLAHLQAGQEQRAIAPFDAAALLVDLCTTTHPFAHERGLFLAFDGPDTLQVEGDALKVRRIAQNLLLNALEYTDSGGVTVTFGDGRDSDPNRWMIRIRDTGPGFESGPSGPLAGVLKAATTESKTVEHDLAGGPTPLPEGTPSPDPGPGHRRRGEGIGLAIVKRLCELLDATLELDSRPGTGSEFRVILPRRYS
jgi:signal transduction histidine kinase